MDSDFGSVAAQTNVLEFAALGSAVKTKNENLKNEHEKSEI